MSRVFFVGSRRLLIALLLALILSGAAYAQGTAFTYQGRLTDSGNPADGVFDMQFKLFDNPTVGTGAQQGATITNAAVQVENGIFTVELNFGACAGCFDGTARFLEIALRPAGSPDPYTVLGPRQAVTNAPYAIRSNVAAAADALSASCVGCVTSGQIQSVAGGAVTGAIPVASVPAGSANYIHNTTTQQASANFNISGDGAVGGALSASVVNALTRYDIGGLRMLAASGPFSSGAFNLAASNTFLGERAGINTTPGAALSSFIGKFNTFMGADAGLANSTGQFNAFFGADAGRANTASGNSFFGAEAGQTTTTGSDNSYFGRGAGGNSTTGSNNSFFGTGAGLNNLTGNGNSFFGTFAGDANEAGNNNTLIGHFADVGSNNLSNATAIGAFSVVAQSNSLVLGSVNGVNGATATVNVGIGTTTPVDRLHVRGDIRVGTGTTGCVKDADGTVLTGSCSSDARLKQAITAFPATLDRLVRLRPVHFLWRAKQYPDRAFGDKQSYGLIAQEVEEVMPELVAEDERGYKVVNYSKLPLMSVQAIKELKSENDDLKKLLLRQQSQMEALKKVVCQIRPDAHLCR